MFILLIVLIQYVTKRQTGHTKYFIILIQKLHVSVAGDSHYRARVIRFPFYISKT